jgi:hypothetical protein
VAAGSAPAPGSAAGWGRGGAPAWDTVTPSPAITTRPVRAAPPFGRTSKRTLPSPSPAAPLSTSIHDASLAAVQAHDATAPTATVTIAPAASTLAEVGVTV